MNKSSLLTMFLVAWENNEQIIITYNVSHGKGRRARSPHPRPRGSRGPGRTPSHGGYTGAPARDPAYSGTTM